MWSTQSLMSPVTLSVIISWPLPKEYLSILTHFGVCSSSMVANYVGDSVVLEKVLRMWCTFGLNTLALALNSLNSVLIFSGTRNFSLLEMSHQMILPDVCSKHLGLTPTNFLYSINILLLKNTIRWQINCSGLQNCKNMLVETCLS